MSEHTLDLVHAIRARLRHTIRRITLAEAVFGLIACLGLVAAGLLAATAIEAGLWLDPTPRSLVLWALVLVTAGLLLFYPARPLLRLLGVLPSPSETAVAREIGVRYPQVSDRLVNLLDLADGRTGAERGPLLDGAVRMLGEQIRPVPFERMEDYARARRAGRLASVPLLGLVVFFASAPGAFVGATHRLFSPGVRFERPAAFRFDVTPGDVEVVRGASLELSARTAGSALPREAVLSVRHEDEEHVETVALAVDSSGAFRHTLVNVRRPLRYRLAAAGVETPWYRVRTIERPLVRGLQLSLEAPAYTRLPPRRLDPNVGDFSALPGSRVRVEVALGEVDVSEAALLFDDSTTVPLRIEGREAAGEFVLRREGRYQVLLRSRAGIPNADPIAHSMTVVADEPPTIQLLAPEAGRDLTESLQVGLLARMLDDFGFSRLRLHYRLAESRFGEPTAEYRMLDLPLARPSLLDQEIGFDWQLAPTTGLDLVPGDVVEYYLQVWDNDAVAGFKSAVTEKHLLRFPSLAEQYEQLDAEQDETESSMENLLQETEQVREQFEQLRDELRQKQEADWEDKRQLEQLQERQQSLENSVDRVQQQLESITEKMEENSLVSDETLRMYEELKRVAEEVNSPELQEALRKLQEALQNMDLGKMQEALEQFEFNEQQYQQRLERTIELFKRLRTEQKLEQVARMAKELAEQEQRLSEETRELREPGRRPEDERERSRPPARQDETPQERGEPRSGETPEPERPRPDGEPPRQPERSDEPPAGPEARERLAREQDRAREEAEKLEQQLEQLREQMEELKKAPKQQMNQMQQQLERRQLPQQMQQNSEQLRQNQLQEAEQGQQQMQQQLEQLSQQLSQMQQQMQGSQTQVDMAGLRRALDDVLTLSRGQETLRDNVRDLATESPTLREFAQKQVELSEGLSAVTDSLQRLSRTIPQMTREVQQRSGNALHAMGSALASLSERQVPQAAGAQKEAMTHLNELALLLSDLLDQLRNSQNSGQGGSMSMQQMLQQLQQMAGQQQQLNEQLQQMLNDMQGERLTQDQGERLGQIARQQEALRRQLDELSKNRELGDKLLGDLGRVADQMEETIRELQQQQVSRQTVQRQQQILSRLLDAQRSLQERGREKKREAESGKDRARATPPELSPAESSERLRRDLIRALESGYAPDFEDLIKRYFDLLQQREGAE